MVCTFLDRFCLPASHLGAAVESHEAEDNKLNEEEDDKDEQPRWLTALTAGRAKLHAALERVHSLTWAFDTENLPPHHMAPLQDWW